MTPRILILTAGYGEGHNAAAHGLAAACRVAHGEVSALVADPFALAWPRFNALSRRGYLALINRAPRAWSSIYAWSDRSRLLTRLIPLFWREIRSIENLITEYAPTSICSTYPLHGFFLEIIAQRRGRTVPHFNIVTDSISINSLWWRSDCDGWFVPNEDSAEVMRAAGVESRDLHILGFPVARFFGDNTGELHPPSLERNAKPRVLYIINSRRPQAAAAARLLLEQTDWEITCAVGRNEPLRIELAALAKSRPQSATILGWTDQIPRLLMTHHVVISKAGGATTQEALAARCPMIVNQVVPGQEEGNYELLRRHGIGALAEEPDEIVQELRRAFSWNGNLWRKWRTALEPLSRPHAAEKIIGRVVALSPNVGPPLAARRDASPQGDGAAQAPALREAHPHRP